MNEQITVPVEQINHDCESAVLPVMERAKSIKVNDPQSYQDALTHCHMIKTTIKNVERQFKPSIDAADESIRSAKAAKAGIVQMIDKIVLPMEQEAKMLSTLALMWKTKTEDDAKNESARLQKLADTQTERDRTALLKKAESCKTEAKREEYAQRAAEVQNTIVAVPTEIPKVKGVNSTTRWHAEIVDVDLIPRKYMLPDTVTLNKLAVALKTNFDVPGAKAVAETNMQFRTKK